MSLKDKITSRFVQTFSILGAESDIFKLASVEELSEFAEEIIQSNKHIVFTTSADEFIDMPPKFKAMFVKLFMSVPIEDPANMVFFVGNGSNPHLLFKLLLQDADFPLSANDYMFLFPRVYFYGYDQQSLCKRLAIKFSEEQMHEIFSYYFKNCKQISIDIYLYVLENMPELYAEIFQFMRDVIRLPLCAGFTLSQWEELPNETKLTLIECMLGVPSCWGKESFRLLNQLTQCLTF